MNIMYDEIDYSLQTDNIDSASVSDLSSVGYPAKPPQR